MTKKQPIEDQKVEPQTPVSEPALKADSPESYKKQVDDITAIAKQVQADFENYKKRVEKDFEQFKQNATKKLLKQLLDLNDNFERALQSPDTLKEGIEFIKQQLHKILEDNGVHHLDSVNQTFDPYKHEALFVAKDKNKPNNQIIEEYQKGYSLNGEILRHSKVKVNRH